MIHVALTSIPPRFADLGAPLRALAAQSASVTLWIPDRYERFPNWDGTLPDLPPGIALRRCTSDLGPATKCLPGLVDMDAADHLLICDDDMIYAPGWLDGFAVAAARSPGCAIAASTFPLARIDPALGPDAGDIVQGFAGVLLQKSMLHAARISARDRMVDDIWLSAQLAARATKILPAPHLRAFVTPAKHAAHGLQDAKIDGLTRAQANRRSVAALRAELGIWGA